GVGGRRDEAGLSRATAALLPGPVRDVTGRTTLPQLAALLDGADVMVANDTGPLHLAAALGRPVVAPYTCTKVRLNGPYGAEHGAVESTVPCQGSYVKRCPHMVCMTELTPDRLWPLLCEVLWSWQGFAEVRDQRSEVSGPFVISDLCPLSSRCCDHGRAEADPPNLGQRLAGAA